MFRPPIAQHPHAKSNMPIAMLTRPSTYFTSRAASGMLSAVAIAPGNSAKPVVVASNPSTFWKYSGMIRAVP
jgi:hypothetical protein